MKKRIQSFLKALGAAVAIMFFLVVCMFGIIAELFPSVIPDWIYTVGGIVSAPFVIAFFVVIFKEWRKQRKSKKATQQKA